MKNSLGNKIKQARLSKGITQKQLANKLGCTDIMISRYELGISQVSISQLEKIASILKKPISSFFDKNNTSTLDTISIQKQFKNGFVFDLDDTLVDGRRFCGETIARVITNIAPSADFELICNLHESIRGLTIKDLYKNILKRLGIDADMEKLLEHDYQIQFENIHKMKIFEGVVDILEFLKSKGKKVYICTNRQKQLLEKVLEANKIQDYFDEVISCVDAGYKKPNPYCLIDLIQKSGIESEEFIYFGDSEVDAQFAQNANIDNIIFDQYLNNKNLFKQLLNMFLEDRINGGR